MQSEQIDHFKQKGKEEPKFILPRLLRKAEVSQTFKAKVSKYIQNLCRPVMELVKNIPTNLRNMSR